MTEREPGLEASFPPKGQVSITNPVNVVVNDSFISPLVELFGEVSVGHGVFVASNTIIRADPGTRVFAFLEGVHGGTAALFPHCSIR